MLAIRLKFFYTFFKIATHYSVTLHPQLKYTVNTSEKMRAKKVKFFTKKLIVVVKELVFILTIIFQFFVKKKLSVSKFIFSKLIVSFSFFLFFLKKSF